MLCSPELLQSTTTSTVAARMRIMCNTMGVGYTSHLLYFESEEIPAASLSISQEQR